MCVYVGALQQREGEVPAQMQQMLLVLQSVHRSPPDDRFFVLQDMVGQVVESYLPMVSKSHSSLKTYALQEGIVTHLHVADL